MAEWKKVIVSGSDAILNKLNVSTNQQIGTTQAATFLTGSFTGSFRGDGTNLSGVTATFPSSQLNPVAASTQVFVNDGSSNKYVTAGQIMTGSYAGVSGDITINTSGISAIGTGKVTSTMILDATISDGDIANATITNAKLANSSITIGNTTTALGASNTSLTGLASVTSTGFTGSLLGTAATASFVAVGSVSGLAAGVATFLATPLSANLASAVTDETGTGNLVFATNPTLVTPILGTPQSVTLTNGTGLPISGLASSTSTALGVGSVELGHATDTTITRVSAGVAAIEGNNIITANNFGTNVATFLATPTSANLANAVTDETGTGQLVFSNNPAFSGSATFAAISASGNVTVGGNLTVTGIITGSATYINSTNVAITDQFILLASGSTSVVDAGIIVQNAAATGEAFYWENNADGTGRWAIASGISPSATSVVATEYNVTAKTAAGAPAGNPAYGGGTNGYGQIYVQSNSDIWIFA